jgi:hypothetical protein
MGHHYMAGLVYGFFELFELEHASVSLGSSDFLWQVRSRAGDWAHNSVGDCSIAEPWFVSLEF